jgi:hypothetical protein
MPSPPGGSEQERVARPLPPTVVIRPVARSAPGLVRQRQHLLPDRRHQLLEAAARQVGPPDGAGEHHIAHERQPAASVEDDVARGVAGRVADLERARPELQRLATRACPAAAAPRTRWPNMAACCAAPRRRAAVGGVQVDRRRRPLGQRRPRPRCGRGGRGSGQWPAATPARLQRAAIAFRLAPGSMATIVSPWPQRTRYAFCPKTADVNVWIVNGAALMAPAPCADRGQPITPRRRPPPGPPRQLHGG